MDPQNDEPFETIEHWSALETSGVVVQPTTAGRVLVVGPDAVDFVHRMSTQAVTGAVHDALNCFVDKRGRLVDVVYQHIDGNAVTLVAEKDATALAAFLNGFLFMEDAEVHVDTVNYVRVIGAGAPSALGLTPMPARWEFRGPTVRTFDYAGPNAVPLPAFVVESDSAEALTTLADSTGAIAEAARIAGGVAGVPGEIHDGNNPLELDLHEALDCKKGCYIGQEVISRIDNYGKQARRLVGVCAADDVIGYPFGVGDSISINGEVVGTISSTSAASCRSRTVPFALARVKCPPLTRPIHAQVGDVDVTLVARAAAQTPHD